MQPRYRGPLRDASQILQDGYIWHKNGQKKLSAKASIPGKPASSRRTRYYFKCAARKCPARRTVDLDLDNTTHQAIAYHADHTCNSYREADDMTTNAARTAADAACAQEAATPVSGRADVVSRHA